MQKFKKNLFTHQHVKLLNCINPDLKHRNILARNCYKKGQKLYFIGAKKSIFAFHCSLFTRKSEVKRQHLSEKVSAELLQGSNRSITQQIRQHSNPHNMFFTLMYEKRDCKKQNRIRELMTFMQKRQTNLVGSSSLLHGPFAKTLLFCQNKAPMSVLDSKSRQYMTKEKQRTTVQRLITDFYQTGEKNHNQVQVSPWNKTKIGMKLPKVRIKLVKQASSDPIQQSCSLISCQTNQNLVSFKIGSFEPNNFAQAPLLAGSNTNFAIGASFPSQACIYKQLRFRQLQRTSSKTELCTKITGSLKQSLKTPFKKYELLSFQTQFLNAALCRLERSTNKLERRCKLRFQSTEFKDRNTRTKQSFVQPFYQLTHTQKLEFLYPTNLDKMSFLSTDLANLALSVDTYTFLKKKKIDKVGNLLEYSPKNLYLFLNQNREMFVELKTCLLLLGFWQKDSLV